MKSFSTLSSLLGRRVRAGTAFSIFKPAFSSFSSKPLARVHGEIIKGLAGDLSQADVLEKVYKVMIHPESELPLRAQYLERSTLPLAVKNILRPWLSHPDRLELKDYADKERILDSLKEPKDDVSPTCKANFWETVRKVKEEQERENLRREAEVEKNQALSPKEKQKHLKTIFAAVQKGDLRKMDQLLAQGKVGVDELLQGKSMLYQAVLHHQLKIVMHLLMVRKADPKTSDEYNPLVLAYQQNQKPMIMLLLRHGASLNEETIDNVARVKPGNK